jgi:hypothetical protein
MHLFRGLTVAAGFMALAAPALAADLPPPPPVEPMWNGSVSVYGWLANMDGDVGIDGLGPVDISSSGGSIFDILDGFFMASGELRYGAWGIFGDFIWVDLGESRTSASGYDSATVGVSTIVGTGALTYTFVDTPEATVQAMAGARVWSVDTDLKLGLDLLGNSTTTSASETIEWVDPLVGARASWQLTEHINASAVGAIGGFGAGSDFMWDVAGTVGYTFTPGFVASVGFRALGVNYDDNGDVVDVTAWGPLAGLTIRF